MKDTKFTKIEKKHKFQETIEKKINLKKDKINKYLKSKLEKNTNIKKVEKPLISRKLSPKNTKFTKVKKITKRESKRILNSRKSKNTLISRQEIRK